MKIIYYMAFKAIRMEYTLIPEALLTLFICYFDAVFIFSITTKNSKKKIKNLIYIRNPIFAILFELISYIRSNLYMHTLYLLCISKIYIKSNLLQLKD